ncbi:MAG: hypothetical protein ACOCUH_03695, partial [Bacteriovoracia bacterium]
LDKEQIQKIVDGEDIGMPSIESDESENKSFEEVVEEEKNKPENEKHPEGPEQGHIVSPSMKEN